MGFLKPKAPKIDVPPPAPEEPEIAKLDEEADARVEASRRAMLERQRRNRVSLRQDIIPTYGGAGIAIPR